MVKKMSSLEGNVITNIGAQRTTSERRSGQRNHSGWEGLQRRDAGGRAPETRTWQEVGFGAKVALQHEQVRSVLAQGP